MYLPVHHEFVNQHALVFRACGRGQFLTLGRLHLHVSLRGPFNGAAFTNRSKGNAEIVFCLDFSRKTVLLE